MIMIVVYIQYPLIMSISKRSRGFVVVVVVVDVVFFCFVCLFILVSRHFVINMYISSLCNKH